MDGLVIMLFALLWALINRPTAEVKDQPVIHTETVSLNPYLNPSMYHDEQAFMLIANELGFH